MTPPPGPEHRSAPTLAAGPADGPLTEAETFAPVSSAARRSLGVVHAAAIVHRGVKPANTMLDPDGGRRALSADEVRALAAW